MDSRAKFDKAAYFYHKECDRGIAKLRGAYVYQVWELLKGPNGKLTPKVVESVARGTSTVTPKGCAKDLRELAKAPQVPADVVPLLTKSAARIEELEAKITELMPAAEAAVGIAELGSQLDVDHRGLIYERDQAIKDAGDILLDPVAEKLRDLQIAKEESGK